MELIPPFLLICTVKDNPFVLGPILSEKDVQEMLQRHASHHGADHLSYISVLSAGMEPWRMLDEGFREERFTKQSEYVDQDPNIEYGILPRFDLPMVEFQRNSSELKFITESLREHASRVERVFGSFERRMKLDEAGNLSLSL